MKVSFFSDTYPLHFDQFIKGAKNSDISKLLIFRLSTEKNATNRHFVSVCLKQQPVYC